MLSTRRPGRRRLRARHRRAAAPRARSTARSATSAPTCSAPTGTRTRRSAGSRPTRTGRSARRCSTSATSPASATCTPPSSASPAACTPTAGRRRCPTCPGWCAARSLMLEANKERAGPVHHRRPARGPATLGLPPRRGSPAAAAAPRSRWPCAASPARAGERTGARAASPPGADHAAAVRRRRRRRRPPDRGRPGMRRRPTAVAASSSDGVGDLAQHVGQRHVEGRAQRGEQLGGGFLLAALDLGDVAQADPRLGGDLAQGHAAVHPPTAEHVAERADETAPWRVLSGDGVLFTLPEQSILCRAQRYPRAVSSRVEDAPRARAAPPDRRRSDDGLPRSPVSSSATTSQPVRPADPDEHRARPACPPAGPGRPRRSCSARTSRRSRRAPPAPSPGRTPRRPTPCRSTTVPATPSTPTFTVGRVGHHAAHVADATPRARRSARPPAAAGQRLGRGHGGPAAGQRSVHAGRQRVGGRHAVAYLTTLMSRVATARVSVRPPV